jgi:hypothetical protein
MEYELLIISLLRISQDGRAEIEILLQQVQICFWPIQHCVAPQIPLASLYRA